MTRTQRGTLAATGLGLFMIFLDALIVNVALPDIGTAFDVGESGLQWMVTAYSLAMAASMMTGATVADRWGRKHLYVAGLAVFVAASVACGLAPSIAVLNAARAVQGLAAAAVNVTSLALVSAAFSDPDLKARAIGIWSAIAAIGVALGPTLGGVLTEAFGWRSVFFVNLVFGVAALALTLAYVVESRSDAPRGFDLPGQILYVVAVGAFALAAIEAPQVGWTSPTVAGGIVVCGAALGAFVWWELRTAEPMMDVRLFRNLTYTLAIVTIFVTMFSVYGMLLLISQLWQDVLAYSVLTTGMLLLPLAVIQTITSPIAGRLVATVGARRLVLLGLTLLSTALAIQAIGIGISEAVVAVGVAIVGAGQAFTMTPATAVARGAVPEDRAGMASGILSSQRALGSTAGYAICGSILVAWLTATLGPSLDAVIPDETEREAVATVIIERVNPRAYSAEIGPERPLPGASSATREEIAAAAEAEFRAGTRLALAFAAAALFVVLIVDWRVIPPDRPRRAGAVAAET